MIAGFVVSGIQEFLVCLLFWKVLSISTAPSDWTNVAVVCLTNAGWCAVQGLMVGLWFIVWGEMTERGLGALGRWIALAAFLASVWIVQELVAAIVLGTRTSYITEYQTLFASSLGIASLVKTRRIPAWMLLALQAFAVGVVTLGHSFMNGNVGVILWADGIGAAVDALAILVGARLAVAGSARWWNARGPGTGPFSARRFAAFVWRGVWKGALVAIILFSSLLSLGLLGTAFFVAIPAAFLISLWMIQVSGPPQGRLGGLPRTASGLVAGAGFVAILLALTFLGSLGYSAPFGQAFLVLGGGGWLGWNLWWAYDAALREA